MAQEFPEGWWREGREFAFPGSDQWTMAHYRQLCEAMTNLRIANVALKSAQYNLIPFSLYFDESIEGVIWRIHALDEMEKAIDRYRKLISIAITTAERDLGLRLDKC